MRALLVFLMFFACTSGYAQPHVTLPKGIYYPITGEDEMTELIFSYGLKVQKEKRLFLEQSYVILETPQAVLNRPFSRCRNREWHTFVEKQTANWLPINGPIPDGAEQIAANPTVDRVYMFFTTQAIIGIPEARRLIVEIAEGLVAEMNADESYARCYHREHRNQAYTASNLIIKIDFETYFGKYVDPLRIGSIVLEGGVTHFWAWNGKKYYGDCWEYRNEAYYKSKQLVLIERQQQAAEYFQVIGETGPDNANYNWNGTGAYSVAPPVQGAFAAQRQVGSLPSANRSFLGNGGKNAKSLSVVQTNFGNSPAQQNFVQTIAPQAPGALNRDYGGFADRLSGTPQNNYQTNPNAAALPYNYGIGQPVQGAFYQGGNNNSIPMQGGCAAPIAGGLALPSMAANNVMPQQNLPAYQGAYDEMARYQMETYGNDEFGEECLYQDQMMQRPMFNGQSPQFQGHCPPQNGQGSQNGQMQNYPPNVPPPPGTVEGGALGAAGLLYPGFVGNYPNVTWADSNVIPYPYFKFYDGWIFMRPDPVPPPSPMTPTEAPQTTPAYIYR